MHGWPGSRESDVVFAELRRGRLPQPHLRAAALRGGGRGLPEAALAGALPSTFTPHFSGCGPASSIAPA